MFSNSPFGGGDGFEGYNGFPGLPGMGGGGARGKFTSQYRCYSVSIFTERREVEEGGKVILPPSALDALTQLNTAYPMLFKMTNPSAGCVTYCGVLEFIADEGKIILPYWMMSNLKLQEGDFLNIESVTLALGSYVLLEPQSRGILDLTNPKAVLESSLRRLSCLSVGDMLKISYNKKTYQFKVKKLKPADAVSIIECDLSVDFAPYVGAEEDEQKMKHKMKQAAVDMAQEQMVAAEKRRIDKALQEVKEGANEFEAFTGKGNVLEVASKSAGKSGAGRGVKKTRRKGNVVADSSALAGGGGAESAALSNGHGDVLDTLATLGRERGIPNFSYERGSLHFTRLFPKKEEAMDDAPAFSAFGGDGHCLRKKKR